MWITIPFTGPIFFSFGPPCPVFRQHHRHYGNHGRLPSLSWWPASDHRLVLSGFRTTEHLGFLQISLPLGTQPVNISKKKIYNQNECKQGQTGLVIINNCVHQFLWIKTKLTICGSWSKSDHHVFFLQWTFHLIDRLNKKIKKKLVLNKLW